MSCELERQDLMRLRSGGHLGVDVEVKRCRCPAGSRKLDAAYAGDRDEGDRPLDETQARS